MPTFGNMIDEVVSELHGWGAAQDRITFLAAPMLNTDSTFTVTATSGQAIGITPGVVEVDSELIYITSADPTTGICVVAPSGRGYRGTVAVAHAVNTAVLSRPRFPRGQVARKINEIIGGLYPQLFAVVTTSTIAPSIYSTYALPDTARHILAIQWQAPGVADWINVRRIRREPFDNSVRIGDVLPTGQPVRIAYAIEPSTMVNETDDYVTVTGLPVSTYDLAVTGATARLMTGPDIARTQVTAVEQSDRNRVVPPNAGLTVSQYLQKVFTDRLKSESMSLRDRYPIKTIKGF